MSQGIHKMIFGRELAKLGRKMPGPERAVSNKSRRDCSRPLRAAEPRNSILVPYSIHTRPQLPRARGMPQFSERLGFNLPDTFACDRKRLPDFFQGVL